MDGPRYEMVRRPVGAAGRPAVMNDSMERRERHGRDGREWAEPGRGERAGETTMGRRRWKEILTAE